MFGNKEVYDLYLNNMSPEDLVRVGGVKGLKKKIRKSERQASLGIFMNSVSFWAGLVWKVAKYVIMILVILHFVHELGIISFI